MMTLKRYFAHGVLASEYRADAGDGLPMHEHPHGEGHLTMVLCGRILISGPGWSKELSGGTVETYADLPGPHEIKVLEDGTVFTNISAFACDCGPLVLGPDPHHPTRK